MRFLVKCISGPQARRCVRFRESSLEYAYMCVQSPCPNYLVGYELHTDLPPRRVGILGRQNRTKLFVDFALISQLSSWCLLTSHRRADDKRELKLPSKKKYWNSRQDIARKFPRFRGAFNPLPSSAFLSCVALRFLSRFQLPASVLFLLYGKKKKF